MRTTLIIADELVENAREATGIDRISDLVREGLQALVAREARARLAAMGGSDVKARSAERRRPPQARRTTRTRS